MSSAEIDTEYKHGLSEMAVEIDSPAGRLAVPGFTHQASPGLAVTMYPFGCFTVTHIGSGLKISNRFERASSALLVMSQFALVAAMKDRSWSDLDKDSARNLIREAGEYEVPFDGYTSTSKGITRKMTVSEWFQSVRFPIFDEFPWEETDPFESAIQNFDQIGAAA